MIKLGESTLNTANELFRKDSTVKMFRVIDRYLIRMAERRNHTKLTAVSKFKKFLISRILCYGKIPISYLSVINSGFNEVLLRFALKFGSSDSLQVALMYYIKKTGRNASSKLKGNCKTVEALSSQLSFPWNPSVDVSKTQASWLLDKGYVTS